MTLYITKPVKSLLLGPFSYQNQHRKVKGPFSQKPFTGIDKEKHGSCVTVSGEKKRRSAGKEFGVVKG